MGKKRKRAVLTNTDQVDLDSLYFDNLVDTDVPRPADTSVTPKPEQADHIEEQHNSLDTPEPEETSHGELSAQVQGTVSETEEEVDRTTEAVDRIDALDQEDEEYQESQDWDHEQEQEPQHLSSDADPLGDELVNNNPDQDESVIIISDTTNGSDDNRNDTLDKSEEVIEIGTSAPSSPLFVHSSPPNQTTNTNEYAVETARPSLTMPEPSSDLFVEQEAVNPARPSSSVPAPARPTYSGLPGTGPSIELTVVCLVPGKATTRTQSWNVNTPLYSLEKELGLRTDQETIPSVFVHKDHDIRKFSKPSQLDPGAESLKIVVLSDNQWRAVESGVSLKELGLIENDDDDDGSEKEENNSRFPITLEGKEGQVRVLVTPASVVADLVRHYLKSKGLPLESNAVVKFDGDKVEASSSLEDLDIEEDDKLDIYVTNV